MNISQRVFKALLNTTWKDSPRGFKEKKTKVGDWNITITEYKKSYGDYYAYTAYVDSNIRVIESNIYDFIRVITYRDTLLPQYKKDIYKAKALAKAELLRLLKQQGCNMDYELKVYAFQEQTGNKAYDMIIHTCKDYEYQNLGAYQARIMATAYWKHNQGITVW